MATTLSHLQSILSVMSMSPPYLSFKPHLQIQQNNIHLLYLDQQFQDLDRQMQNSRARQFDAIRSQKLSDNSSHLSKSSINQHAKSNTSYNHTFTNSFIKKQQKDLCISCTNRSMASQQRQQNRTDRALQTKQQQQALMMIGKIKDEQAQNRIKMKKQALQYNKTLISRQFGQTQSQKMLDIQYIQHLVRQQKQQIEQQNKAHKKTKQQALKYGKQLYRQLQDEQKRKQQELKSIKTKKKDQSNTLPLPHHDKSQLVQQYIKDLKSQIEEKKMEKEFTKEVDVLQAKIALETAEKQFQKYHNDLKQQKESNPQVFISLKQMDQAKKSRKLVQIKQKQRQRKKEMAGQRQRLKQQIDRQIEQRKQYIKQLQGQVRQKKRRQLQLREQQVMHKMKVYDYSEDVMRQTRKIKPCQSCHIQYDEKCFH